MAQWLVGGAILLCAVIVSVVGLLLARRAVDHAYLRQHNDVAGFIYAVVGVLYAVLLAFVVVAVWQRHEDTRHAVDAEASIISEIYRDTIAFPDSFQREMRQALLSYTDALSEHEWQSLQSHQGSAVARAALDRLWRVYAGFVPQDANDQIWYSEMLHRLNLLVSYRQDLISAAQFELPSVMWSVLLVGGVIVIAFAYLFGTENATAHFLMVGALAATVALSILLIWALEHPFGGLAYVNNEPIRALHAHLLTTY